jgi:hypothetical protein
MSELYRIFVNDFEAADCYNDQVPWDGWAYSGLEDVEANSVEEVLDRFASVPRTGYYLALPHTRKDLWPDGKTGRVSKEAIKLGCVVKARR